jgi:hypothetical protein
MKPLISLFVVTFALAIAGSALAEDVTKATTKAACDKAGGTWDGSKCSKERSGY